jgi:RimJ/RimL family protein N-acetyltransferase
MARQTAREMKLSEVDLIIEYFHKSSHEYLNGLGVDPAKLPDPAKWRVYYEYEYSQPVEKRKTFLVIWELDETPIGFSTTDKIVFGEEAYMHLHILTPEQRGMGNGSAYVRETVKIYFDSLKLERLFCEPYAFNIAPNRTLQKVGFKYIKTHEIIPGPLNFYQPVNRWMLKKKDIVSKNDIEKIENENTD